MKCKRKIMVGIAFVAVVLCILFQSNTFGRKKSELIIEEVDLKNNCIYATAKNQLYDTDDNYIIYLEVSLSVCHGHSQVRDNAQSHHSAQAGRTPRACCIVANQVQLAVPGYCRIRPRWQGSQWQWQSHQRTGLPLGWCPYYSAKNVLFENYSGQKFDFVSFECPL